MEREIQEARTNISNFTDSLTRARNRIKALEEANEKEAAEAAAAHVDWSKETLSKIDEKWMEDHAAVADQVLYWSTQTFNFDPAAVTTAPEIASFSPQMFEVDANGIDVAEVQVIDFFDQKKFANGIRSALGLSTDDGGTSPVNGSGGTSTAGSDQVRTAASQNREVFQYREESAGYLRQIKQTHTEAKAFALDIRNRTTQARNEFVQIIRTIDEALGH
ncbi:hypothetical protein [Streptomyces sp. NBC_01618]|uniref:hypothetical protein n=1 Tax=Streptomyces sp. NBC_01618 TaxID=2975900 RepID=UPI003864152D|nr:hypothetical protein OH735_22095 [Streptomyces sp. NBC_01618]